MRYIKTLLLATALLLVLFTVAGAQNAVFGGSVFFQQLGGNQTTLQSITLTVDNQVIPVGGTANFTASGQYSDGSQKDVTALAGASLISGTPSVLSVGVQATPWPTTGVTGGTSNVSFTYGGVTSNTITETVNVVVIITTTVLPSAQVGTAYSTTLSASGGTPPYTWNYNSSCPTGTGLTCNTGTGVISGTPANNTGTPFTINVTATDSAAHSSATTAFTLIVLPAAGACGPTATPPYNCSQHSLATQTVLPTPNVGGTTGVNTVVFPYSVSTDFYYPVSGTGNGITRMTDANTCGGNSAWPSIGGGSEEILTDTSNSYIRFSCSSGGAFFMSLSTNGGGYIQNALTNGSSGNAPSYQRASEWSMVTAKRVWSVVNVGNNKLDLVSHDLTGVGTVTSTDTDTGLNFLACPGIPNPFPVVSGGYPYASGLRIENTDRYFAFDAASSSTVNNGDWVMVIDRNTSMCSSFSVLTGNWWTWCTLGTCPQNNTSPTGTMSFGCPAGQLTNGIHAMQIFRNSSAVQRGILKISNECGGNGGTPYYRMWQPGTGNIMNLGPNPSTGVNWLAAVGHAYPAGGWVTGCAYQNPQGINWSDVIGSWANYFATGAFPPINTIIHPPSGDYNSCHGANYLVGQDVGPVSLVTGGGTSATDTTPVRPLMNEAFAAGMNGSSSYVSRFTPTYSQFSLSGTYFAAQYAIGIPSQDGTLFCFASNWNGTLGLDKTGKPRTDMFCLSKLQ